MTSWLKNNFAASRQSGFGAVVYILLAIFLIGLVVGGIAGRGEDISDALLHQKRTEIYNQATMIMDVIIDCPNRYGYRGEGSFIGYPSSRPDGGDMIRPIFIGDIRCPGNQGNVLWGTDHFLPKPIPGYKKHQGDKYPEWRYMKNKEAVSIAIHAEDKDLALKINPMTAARFEDAETCGDQSQWLVIFVLKSIEKPSHCSYYP